MPAAYLCGAYNRSIDKRLARIYIGGNIPLNDLDYKGLTRLYAGSLSMNRRPRAVVETKIMHAWSVAVQNLIVLLGCYVLIIYFIIIKRQKPVDSDILLRLYGVQQLHTGN